MPGSSSRLPNQRWQIVPSQPEQAASLSQALHLDPLIAQVLLNRGIATPEAAQIFLNPELQTLPSPLTEFEDLPIALELLLRAIADRQFIAICGDYDADGMTSTALLLQALRFLGAVVDYAIPSRMQEGYGINRRIIEEFAQEGVGLILTVDNGIAAHEPIAHARELGLAVIVTDHHDIPPTLPPANAILNPKLLPQDSPYRGAAGVGVAYILAVCLAQSLQKTQDLTTPLIELFTLGTIADLAPLTGVNRRWVKRGLKLLPKSRIAGIQALIQVAGLSNETTLKPEAIGFRLGPRINAIGRISDPQIVIELLTTNEDGRALELAMKCEQVNQLRQRLCELIEQEAIAWCHETRFDPQQARVLVIVQSDWHHGVIGIVASRLVERYGVPVFIGTYETKESEAPDIDEASAAKIRGSARGIAEFDVFAALQYCAALLGKFGGHRAAGGFTLDADRLEEFQARLEQFAKQTLRPEHLKPLIKVDVQADFRDLTLELFERLDILHPCGIENPDPVFWTANVHIVEQRLIGRDQSHLKLTLSQVNDPTISIRAVAWRWGEYYPLMDRIDVAYRLRLNEWNGTRSVELELVGARPAAYSNHDLDSHVRSDVELESINHSANESEEASVDTASQSLKFRQTEEVAPAHETEQISAVPMFQISQPNRFLTDLFQSPDSDITNLSSSKSESGNGDVSFYDTSPHDSLIDAVTEELSCFDVSSLLNLNPDLSHIQFYYGKRKYTGSVHYNGSGKELRIGNVEGELLIVQPERRKGFLGQLGKAIEEIDVSQPHYFNLVRSALTALELAEKCQLIEQQHQIILAKDQQIEHLNQQLEQLQQQIQELKLQQRQHAAIKLSSPKIQAISTEPQQIGLQPEKQEEDQIQEHISEPIDKGKVEQNNQNIAIATDDIQAIFGELSESTPSSAVNPTVKPNDPKQRMKQDLGEQVCSRLDLRSQKDLVAAYKKLIGLEAEAATAANPDDCPIDYSDVGLRLCSVIEREVIQPFFRELHQFLLKNDEPCTIGGIALRARKKYTLGMLPALLAAEWRSFQDEALSNSTASEADLYIAIRAVHLLSPDRNMVQVFLAQWEHPLAMWLQNQIAASMIAQLDKLLTIAADAETSLQHGQFERLQALILGNSRQMGILQQIYC